MCCGTPQFVYSTYSTKICTYCGVEVRVPFENTDVVYQGAGPIMVCYSRTKRFETMLKSVCYPKQSFPKMRVVAELKTKDHNSIESVLSHLKKIKLPNKCYMHLHLYCCICQTNYMEPSFVGKSTIRDIIGKFMQIERNFIRQNITTFFSYTWLLRKLLTEFGLQQYVPFVKEIKCKKRNTMYHTLYNTLIEV